MISKNKIKLIHSLEIKKYRKEHNSFIAEGHKLVEDLLQYFECSYICAKREWIEKNQALTEKLKKKGTEIDEVNENELSKASLLKTPQNILAIFKQKKEYIDEIKVLKNSLCLALDGVQDPGNLGTIVRIADWFGIEHIFCSNESADIYNPKTVQATMGAMSRVHVHYTDLEKLIQQAKETIPIYGTFLNGENIYTKQLSENGLIIMGNEGKGISPQIECMINNKLLIPNYPTDRKTSESLNVAVATSIICSEFRRRSMK